MPRSSVPLQLAWTRSCSTRREPNPCLSGVRDPGGRPVRCQSITISSSFGAAQRTSMPAIGHRQSAVFRRIGRQFVEHQRQRASPRAAQTCMSSPSIVSLSLRSCRYRGSARRPAGRAGVSPPSRPRAGDVTCARPNARIVSRSGLCANSCEPGHFARFDRDQAGDDGKDVLDPVRQFARDQLALPAGGDAHRPCRSACRTSAVTCALPGP